MDSLLTRPLAVTRRVPPILCYLHCCLASGVRGLSSPCCPLGMERRPREVEHRWEGIQPVFSRESERLPRAAWGRAEWKSVVPADLGRR